MVYGFGAIDYVVVAFATALTAYLLMTRPERLLLFLPTLLTIDFFIPFVTQLTPARIVPVMLGAWLIMFNKTSLLRPYPNWMMAFFAVLAGSLIFAFLKDDAGSRPFIRALFYLGLAFTFLFVIRMCQTRKALEWAITGLVFAALLHGAYSIYQMAAVQMGLPFRGIVYSETGVGVAYAGPAGLRINGLADEPKRLGHVLFVGAIACLALTSWRQHRAKRLYLFGASITLAGLSLFTFSSSYLAALVLWAPFLAIISRWARAAGVVAVVGAVLIFAVAPERSMAVVDGVTEMVEMRRSEVVARLDARKVYRQEFYAEDFLGRRPETFFTGVGLGRYNRVLNNEYGAGVGYSELNGIIPINSQIYEVSFDFGIAGIVIVYLGCGLIFFQLKHRTLESSALAGSGWFVLVQSLFINNLLFLFYLAAVGTVYLAVPCTSTQHHSARYHPRTARAAQMPAARQPRNR